MNECLIPWDFLWILLFILILALIIVIISYALMIQRRARLTSPRKDYIYRPQSTRKVRE